MNQREAFEKWVIKAYGYTDYSRVELLDKFDDGEYTMRSVSINWDAWQAATEQGDKESPLQQDGIPSFYISTRGYPCCTHRLHESDIPVWCKTADQASDAMDAISDIQLSPNAPPKPTGGGVPIERPINCRNALRDEGKGYPKSGCQVCGDGGLRGCPFEHRLATQQPPER